MPDETTVDCGERPASKGLDYFKQSDLFGFQIYQEELGQLQGTWTSNPSGGTWTYGIAKDSVDDNSAQDTDSMSSSQAPVEEGGPPEDSDPVDTGDAEATVSSKSHMLALTEKWSCESNGTWFLESVQWSASRSKKEQNPSTPESTSEWTESSMTKSSTTGSTHGSFQFHRSDLCPTISVGINEVSELCLDPTCKYFSNYQLNDILTGTGIKRNFSRQSAAIRTTKDGLRLQQKYRDDSSAELWTCRFGKNAVMLSRYDQTKLSDEYSTESGVVTSSLSEQYWELQEVINGKKTYSGEKGKRTVERDVDGFLTSRAYRGERVVADNLKVGISETFYPQSNTRETLKVNANGPGLGWYYANFSFDTAGQLVCDNDTTGLLQTYNFLNVITGSFLLSPTWPDLKC